MFAPGQERFIDEYLVDLNATQAAIRAGYSPKTADQQGSRLLKNVKIATEIARRQAERRNRTEVTADRVIIELGRIALLDPRMAFNHDGTMKPIHELDPALVATLASVETEEEVTDAPGKPTVVTRLRKVRFWNKVDALTTLCKHFGLLTDKLRVEGEVKIHTPPPLNLAGMNAEELSQFRQLVARALPAPGNHTGSTPPGD
jgi:phage terminase small subunit